MNNELYIGQILDEYVLRKLTREEAVTELNRQGVSNAVYELELHLAAAVALRKGSVLQQVKNVHQQFLQAQQEKISSRNSTTARVISLKQSLKWISRVAAVVFIIAASWFTYTYSTTTSKSIYAEIYQPYNVNNDRASIDEIVPHNMVLQFRSKDYAAVIKTFGDLSLTNNREKFLTAIAYQETGSYSKAISLFEQVLKVNQEKQSRLYNDEAEFYLALNYLKVKNTDAAIALFRKIYDDPGHTFQERVSKASLRKMKWLK